MQKYFAAANTAKGFVSWFDDIFSPTAVDYTYIIKGGSGTGKSTLMKTAAAVAAGQGGEVEYFHCSSDPSSLDGVIITLRDGKKISMLDGTAPHTYDPKYPGVCDEIINLGGYWDKRILEKSHDKVISLSKKKSKLFSEAYEDFSAAGVLTESLIAKTALMTDTEKLDGASMRLLTKRMFELKYKPRENRKKRIRGLSALSTEGKSSFDSFLDVDKVYVIADTLFSAPLAFDSIMRAADSLGLSYDRAPMALLPRYSEGIRFRELSMAIISDSHGRDLPPINMGRFVDKSSLSRDDRRHLREVSKGIHAIVSSGLTKLSLVKLVHGELEKIYGSAMNFEKLSRDSKKIISEITA